MSSIGIFFYEGTAESLIKYEEVNSLSEKSDEDILPTACGSHPISFPVEQDEIFCRLEEWRSKTITVTTLASFVASSFKRCYLDNRMIYPLRGGTLD